MYRQSVASEYETENDASNSEFVNVSNSKETNNRDAKPVLTAILSKMEGKNEALPAWASFESYGPSFVYDSTMSPETRFVSLSLTDRRNIKTDAMKSKKDPNFIESVSNSYEYKKKCICGKYYPSLGAQPVDSKDWFSNEAEVKAVRENIEQVCTIENSLYAPLTDPMFVEAPIDPDLEAHASSPQQGSDEVANTLASEFVNIAGSSVVQVVKYAHLDERHIDHASVPSSDPFVIKTQKKSKKDITGSTLRLSIYERNNNRHFVDLQKVLQTIRNHLSERWEVLLITHDEAIQPCLLHAVLRTTNVLLTTHGFQATASLLLPPQAILFEIFPYKYFKPSYLNMVRQLGIHHRWVQNAQPTSNSRMVLRLISQNWCMNSNRCRTHARGDSVQVTDDHFLSIFAALASLESARLPPATVVFNTS